MDKQKQTIEHGTKIAFELIAKRLFETEYKRTFMFFINLSQVKDRLSNYPNEQRQQRQKQSSFEDDIRRFRDQTQTLQMISSINLECSAHGVFNKMKLANVFLDFLEEVFEYKGDDVNVKKLKINISGFNLNSSKELYKIREKSGEHLFKNQECEFSFIHRLKKIVQMGINNLNSLQIRINNVRYCTKEDLRDVLRLGLFEPQREQQKNQLTNLTYELSDWMFYKISHKQNKQKKQKPDLNDSVHKINPTESDKVCETAFLTSAQFQDAVLDSILQQNSSRQDKRLIYMPLMKRFRLQLSTLFYEQASFIKFKSTIKQSDYKDEANKAKYKLKNKKVTQPVQYFHYIVREFIKNISTQVMPNLTVIELDFRNWFKEFEMKQLKDELVNINRKHQLEQIEKQKAEMRNSSMISKQKLDPHNQALGQLFLYFMKLTSNVDPLQKEQIPFSIVVVV